MKVIIHITSENPDGESITDEEWRVIIDFLEYLRKLEGSFIVYFNGGLEL